MRLADAPSSTKPAAPPNSRVSRSPLVIAVVSRAAPHAKIPEWEQVMSAGAAAMALELAAAALGFASTWLTEWCAYDARFRERIGLAAHERIAGFVHIGRALSPPEDRPRPALADIVTYYLTGSPMFYEPHARDKTMLPHDPFKAIIAPRPIGWISTRAKDGRINLAPYSFFNAFGLSRRRSSASPARASRIPRHSRRTAVNSYSTSRPSI